MHDVFTQTYDQTQSVEAPPDVCDHAAEYRSFFKTALDKRIDEELNRASRTARFNAYWDTRSLWLNQEEERLAHAADPDSCCLCGMPRRPGRAALRYIGELESGHPPRHRVRNLRAHFMCLRAFRFMLSNRADATLAAYGLSPESDD